MRLACRRCERRTEYRVGRPIAERAAAQGEVESNPRRCSEEG
jgi:hypothetical protein